MQTYGVFVPLHCHLIIELSVIICADICWSSPYGSIMYTICVHIWSVSAVLSFRVIVIQGYCHSGLLSLRVIII